MADQRQRLQFEIGANADNAKSVIADLKSALSNNFADISKVSEGALKGLNNQVALLARQVPVVGYPLAGITRELFKLGSAKKEVEDLTGAFSKFRTTLTEIAVGKKFNVGAELQSLGINANEALKAPEQAFQKFLTGLRGLDDQTLKNVIGVDVLSASIYSQLVPSLGAATVAEEATTAGAVEMGLALGAVLLPLVAIAVAAIGLEKMTSELFSAAGTASDFGEEIYKAHLKTGIATESLTGYYVAAQRAKVPFDQLSLALARAERSAVEAELGNKKLAQAFLDLGVNTKLALTDSTKFADEFSQKLGNLQSGGKQVDEAFKLVSRSGSNLLPVFDQMKKGVAALVAEADRMGLKLSEQQAKELYAYNLTLRQVQASFKGLEVEIGRDFAPTAIDAIKGFTQILQGAKPIIADVFRGLGVIIQGAIEAIKLFIASVETIPTVFSLMASAAADAGNVLKLLGEDALHVGKSIVFALAGDGVSAALEFGESVRVTGDLVARAATSYVNSAITIARAFKENLAGLHLPTPEVPTGGEQDTDLHPTPKKQRQETAEQILARKLRLLEDDREQQNEHYRSLEEDGKSSYERRITSLRNYVEGAKLLEAVRLAQVEKDLGAEKVLIEASKIPLDEKLAKQADVDKKIEQERDRSNKFVRALDDEQEKKEREAEQAHAVALVAIQDERDKTRIDSLQKFAEKNILLTKDTEDKIAVIELDSFDRHMDLLMRDLRAAGENAEEREKVLDKLNLMEVQRTALIESLAQRQIEAGKKVTSELERQKDAAEELQKSWRDYLNSVQRGITGSKLNLFGGGTEEQDETIRNSGSMWQAFRTTVGQVFDDLSERAGNFRSMIQGTFSGMADAMAQSIQSWVLYGGSIGAAMKQATAAVLASLAAQAGVKALWEVAEGFAALARALFGDPKAGAEAAMHFKSAALYGGVAVSAGLAGRAFASGGATTGAGAAGSGTSSNPTPNNQSFVYGNNSSSPSSAVAQQGSGNLYRDLRNTVDRLTSTVNALTSKPAGVLIRENADHVGAAMTDHSNRTPQFNRNILSNLGLAAV